MPDKDPPKEHQFSVENQPTSEQRKKGAETRKLKLRLKPYIAKYQNMTFGQFAKTVIDIKAHQDNYLMLDIAAINYVNQLSKDFRYICDYLDRIQGRATFKQEITADITENIDITAEIDHTLPHSDERAAKILSILAQSGAIKSGAERHDKGKIKQLDSDSLN